MSPVLSLELLPAARTLSAFRNVHAGETIIVCGCGASLNALPDPGRHVTIGVNDVGRRFDPTYLVVVNPRNQFKADRFRFVEQSGARALFTQLDLGRVRPPVVRFRLGKYGGTDAGGADVLHYTQNSPYVAVCLAAHMGAARIGLIGVDLTDHHFFAATGRHSLAGRLREIDAQYGKLAAALAGRGVELVNLSPVSLLTSLRRARVEADGEWMMDAPPPPALAAGRGATPKRESTPKRERGAMKVVIERRGTGIIGDLMDTLAATTAGLGHEVVRAAPGASGDPNAVYVVWNGRAHRACGPTLYCEHGWLPRADYQISPGGINAGSHVAPFRWDGTPLTADEDAALDAHLSAIKAASFTGYYQYMQAGAREVDDLPPDFLLVPLQIENDTNIVRHAPEPLRTMQGLVDWVARVNPPWPVIFKQHPADERHGGRHLRLRMRRPQDRLWPHARGNVHAMLKSGACRGILTINSNVAHDGLLWDVPAIVLGRNVWPSTGAHLPFLAACPRDWDALRASVESPEGRACRRAYAHYLMTSQWTLADARDPARVAGLLDHAVQAARARRPPRRSVPLAPVARAAPPPARVAKVTRLVPVRRAPERVINVVAENRGWLFEAWKQRYAAASVPGFRVLASNRPLRQADAWIFVRAREAAGTPDFSRTVVQLHDLFDDGLYGPGGERFSVRRCAGLSLTHPGQQELLASAGVDLRQRSWILQPVGWGGATAAPRPRADDAPTVAWIGRPAQHGGEDVTRLDWFVEASRALGPSVRVVLAGERLDAAAAALRSAGVACTRHGLRQLPPDRAAAWIGRFDCVAITGGADSGPWPLFDALHAGVPVVAAPVGWAGRLLADGRCGVLADDPAALARGITEVLADPAEWGARREEMRERVAGYGMDAWIQANLAMAAELAAQPARRSA